MMQACGAEPDDPAEPDVESIGAGTHDHSRLVRFTTFLRDLAAWFAAQPGPPTDEKAVTSLRNMEAHVVCMTSVVQHTITSTLSAPSGDDTGNPDATGSTIEGIVTDASGAAAQLVLDNTEARPLIQEFHGIEELTPECERLADEFIEAWGIELSYYNRKKFLERLLRWISSAPDGQVLVIKMKTAEEPYEPYPSYVARDRLLSRESEPSDEGNP